MIETTTMSTREIKEVFSYLETKHQMLTPYQTDFVRSLKKYFNWKGSLSSRQIDCLVSLKDYIITSE